VGNLTLSHLLSSTINPDRGPGGTVSSLKQVLAEASHQRIFGSFSCRNYAAFVSAINIKL